MPVYRCRAPCCRNGCKQVLLLAHYIPPGCTLLHSHMQTPQKNAGSPVSVALSPQTPQPNGAQDAGPANGCSNTSMIQANLTLAETPEQSEEQSEEQVLPMVISKKEYKARVAVLELEVRESKKIPAATPTFTKKRYSSGKPKSVSLNFEYLPTFRLFTK